MAYCTDKGIRHSEFLQWDPDDRAKVLAWRLEEASRCQLCGTAEWEWEADQYAYEPMHKFCKGCYLKDITSDQEDTLPGTTVTLIPASQITNLMREVEEERQSRRGFQ